jgi:hypothetical protein
MLHIKLKIFFILLLLVTNSSYAATKSTDLFQRALSNTSTAHNFVLISVVNDKTNEEQLVSTLAPFLLGAIHIEHQIPYTGEGNNKTLKLALSSNNRKFHFSNPEALKNIQRYYTEEILNEVRIVLNQFSVRELKLQLRGDGKNLDKLYMGKPPKLYTSYRNAIGHILLERGLLPRRGCIAGYLTIDE